MVILTWGKWYWPIALSAIFAIIMVPETYALVSDDEIHRFDNTLSAWINSVLHIRVGESIGQWSAVDILTFIAYVGVFIIFMPWHFWFRRFL